MLTWNPSRRYLVERIQVATNVTTLQDNIRLFLSCSTDTWLLVESRRKYQLDIGSISRFILFRYFGRYFEWCASSLWPSSYILVHIRCFYALRFPHILIKQSRLLSRAIAASLFLHSPSIAESPSLASFPSPSSTLFISKAEENVKVFKSGRNPSPVDKNDPKKGSKKDTSFLRCVSNCKNDCELPSGGLAAQRSVLF